MNELNNNLNGSSDRDDYSLQELFFVLKKHIKKISLVFLITFFSTFYYTLVTKPLYQSSATIMINEDQKSRSFLEMEFGNDRNYIENQIQILESRTLSEIAVKKLLNSEKRNQLYLFGTKKYIPKYYRTILTFGILDRFNEYNVLNEEVDEFMIEEFSKNLRGLIDVKNERDTDALIITIYSYSSEEAALLVNTVVDVYRSLDLEWITGEMNHLKIFLKDQLEKKEKELNVIEQKLKLFQEEEKIFTLDNNSEILLNSLAEVEKNYNNILAEISIINERLNFNNNQLTSLEKDLIIEVSNSINERLIAFKNEIIQTETELISTITKYGDSHSAALNLKDRLSKLKNNIKIETEQMISDGLLISDPLLYRQALLDTLIRIKTNKANLEFRATAYKSLVIEYDNKLSLLPEKYLEFTKLERTRKIHSDTYSFMSRKLEEANIGEASKLGQIRIIDKGIVNNKPIKPKRMMNLMIGAILGLSLGVLLVFIIEYFDNTIKSVEQIERRNLSILSIIPAIREENKKDKTKKYISLNKTKNNLERKLITHEDPKSPISESYRSLRTSLMYTKNNNNSCNVILVSSSGPGEGKTTTIANLAITYANLGKKTLLVDSDLRKPVVHNVFKFDKSPGLTTFLSNNADLKDIVFDSEVKNLDIISSGVIPPNPSELLDSERMHLFLEEVKNTYDVVLFDSPPLIAVTDAYVLLKNIDQFILVVRAGFAEKGALDRVLSATRQSNYNITGVVLNAMSEEHSYGAGYYYNYYQYYYGDDKNV